MSTDGQHKGISVIPDVEKLDFFVDGVSIGGVGSPSNFTKIQNLLDGFAKFGSDDTFDAETGVHAATREQLVEHFGKDFQYVRKLKAFCENFDTIFKLTATGRGVQIGSVSWKPFEFTPGQTAQEHTKSLQAELKERISECAGISVGINGTRYFIPNDESIDIHRLYAELQSVAELLAKQSPATESKFNISKSDFAKHLLSNDPLRRKLEPKTSPIFDIEIGDSKFVTVRQGMAIVTIQSTELTFEPLDSQPAPGSHEPVPEAIVRPTAFAPNPVKRKAVIVHKTNIPGDPAEQPRVQNVRKRTR